MAAHVRTLTFSLIGLLLGLFAKAFFVRPTPASTFGEPAEPMPYPFREETNPSKRRFESPYLDFEQETDEILARQLGLTPDTTINF